MVFGLLGIFPDGEKYAVFFGAFYGLMEFIPYIGPIIGPAPAVLVALFNDPVSAVWVVLMFVALQQLEGHVVAPQVFRISLRINPIIIILALLIGYQLYGIAGALLALPIGGGRPPDRRLPAPPSRASSRGRWCRPGSGSRRPAECSPIRPCESAAATSTAAPRPALTLRRRLHPDRCPDCGTPPGEGDAFCRACGASLEPTVRTPG